MKIINIKKFNLAQELAAKAISMKNNGEYYQYEWAIAMELLKESYGFAL